MLQEDLEHQSVVFNQVKLGDYAWEQPSYYFKQLLPIEKGFAASKDDIGFVKEDPFAIDVRNGARV